MIFIYFFLANKNLSLIVRPMKLRTLFTFILLSLTFTFTSISFAGEDGNMPAMDPTAKAARKEAAQKRLDRIRAKRAKKGKGKKFAKLTFEQRLARALAKIDRASAVIYREKEPTSGEKTTTKPTAGQQNVPAPQNTIEEPVATNTPPKDMGS